MRIMPVDPRALADHELIEMHDVLTAAADHDHPDAPAPSRKDFSARLVNPWPGSRSACWLRYDGERPVGFACVVLPGGANSAVADLMLAVLPGERRQGTGRDLLREAVRLAYSTGRTTMVSSATDDGPAAGFAGAIGAHPARNDVHEVLRVQPPGALDTVGSEDYELLRLRGPAPAELLEGIATVHQGLADAPVGENTWTHQPYDAARVAAVDAMLEARGLTQLRVLARHRRTGEVVGVTYVIVSRSSPSCSEQGGTTVLAAHRGHRLGLAIKMEMLRWLTVDHPEVHELTTWVAEGNAPIRAVNAQLGYRVIGHWTQWQAPVGTLATTLGLV